MRSGDWGLVINGKVEIVRSKTDKEIAKIAQEKSIDIGGEVRICYINEKTKSLVWWFSFIDGWSMGYE